MGGVAELARVGGGNGGLKPTLRWYAWVWVGLAVVAMGVGGVHQTGQDVNFDQLNYHFYSAYAFLHGRLAIDAAPAGTIHSYFNPLPYVPFYWLVQHLRPRRAIFILGAWHGLNLWLALLIAWQLTATVKRRWRVLLCAGAVGISAASPMALLEWATSFADITTSLCVLGGMAALLASVPGGASRHTGLLQGAGAGLIGVAVGLKLTNAIYAPGILACCLVGETGWGARLRAVVRAGAGGAAGVLLSGGFWFIRMWRSFHNPVFPYYDRLFRSPEIGPGARLHGVSFYDNRFLPHGVWQAISLPFRWVRLNTTTCELGFVDIRFAILAVLAGAVIVLAACGRIPAPPATTRKLFAFIFVSLAVWAYQFGIQRYLVSLEFLAGPAIVAGLVALLPAWGGAVAAFCIAGLSLLTVTVPDFGRIKARESWYGVQLPGLLRAPGLVFLQGDALSYVVPFLPAESRVVGLIPLDALRSGTGTFADRLVRGGLAARPDAPVTVLLGDEPLSPAARDALGSYGLTDAGGCAKVPTHEGTLTACSLHRTAATMPAALTLHPAETLAFGTAMTGTAALLAGFHPDSGWGVIGAGYTPMLDIRLDPAFGAGPYGLSLAFTDTTAGQPDAMLLVRAGGREAGAIGTPELRRAKAVAACIPASALDATREVVIGLAYRGGQAGAAPHISVGLASLKLTSVGTCGS